MVTISIDRLYPHPQNPRGDVGDISELTESIKANGIFQNLTIIEGGAGVPEGADGYTVIIGHRRLAAAKAAGLTELPCSVVKMDEREQVATMLLENMQRQDLTVWEQAQGFQMMLDLGETEQSIADKTGFSKATVKHRVKLLELDKTEFEKSQERQPTMAEYIELESISDPKERNNALKAIGTDNFKWAVQHAKRTIKEREAHKAWKSLFRELGIKEVEPKQADKKEELFENRYVSYDETPAKKDISAVKKAVKEGRVSGYTVRYSSVHVLCGDKVKSRKQKSPEEKAADERLRQIRKLEAQAKELREGFIRNYTGGHEDIVIRAAIEAQASLYIWGDREKKQKEYLGIKEEKVKGSDRYAYLMKRHPEIVLFGYLAMHYECENYRLRLADQDGKYTKNPACETWYETLSKLGYRISDEESRLLDGTHECFKEEEKCQ